MLRDYHRHGRLLDAGTLEEAEASASRAWLADTLAGRRSVLVVDTNEQADRLAGALRAELVRLGRVEEHGVPLGRDGTYAGVGDLVAARRNGWELAGHEGNRRGPINRETYRVTAVGDDGSLTVAPVHGRDSRRREALGEPMVLPADYVAADVSLAYAGTVHAAQGAHRRHQPPRRHPGTSRAARYVGLTRGRDANTAHVATITGPTDPADGSPPTTPCTATRSPSSPGSSTQRRRHATPAPRWPSPTESATDAGSTRTAGELFADAAAPRRHRTHRRAGSTELAADGIITGHDRARLAAEDGAASLTRILRRAETRRPRPGAGPARRGRRPAPRRRAQPHQRRPRPHPRRPHLRPRRARTWPDWTPPPAAPTGTATSTSLADAADRAQR